MIPAYPVWKSLGKILVGAVLCKHLAKECVEIICVVVAP